MLKKTIGPAEPKDLHDIHKRKFALKLSSDSELRSNDE